MGKEKKLYKDETHLLKKRERERETMEEEEEDAEEKREVSFGSIGGVTYPH